MVLSIIDCVTLNEFKHEIKHKIIDKSVKNLVYIPRNAFRVSQDFESL